jgi:hypothetical protein
MTEENNRYIYWKCKKCESHHKSDKKKRWSMDMCKCKESGVDAEEWYSRWLGDAVETSINEYEEYRKIKQE